MAAFLRDDLQDFIDRGEKSHPPVFVGREDILQTITRKALLARKDGASPDGNTRIIQGAPGAGKSSILRELDLRNKRNLRVVNVSDVEVSQSIPKIIASLALAGTMKEPKPISYIEQKKEYAAAKIKPFQNIFLKFGIGLNMDQFLKKQEIHTLSELENKVPVQRWKASVVLAVDEAQNFTGGRSSLQAEFLRSIHKPTTKLPITLVLAGLGDTEDRASDMGLTNGVYSYSIGCFTNQEQKEVIEGFCDYFGIDVGSNTQKLHDFFKSTNGWPRHMHWAQQALAESLLAPAVDGKLDRIGKWEPIERRRDQFRFGYYEDRTSGDMEDSMKLLGAVMTNVRDFQLKNKMLYRTEIHDMITNNVKRFKQRGSAWRLPESHNEKTYVQHLIHQGILQKDPTTKSYVCPIPSFQTRLIRQANFTPEDFDELKQDAKA